MDRSPTYISMCDSAAELQNQWKQEYGDYFVGTAGRIECWIPAVHRVRIFKNRFGIENKGKVIRLSKYIWLPRLNQLIEMAQQPGKRYENTAQDFFDWTKSGYRGLSEGGSNSKRWSESGPGKLFVSLEQLWLAFIMERKHAKIWDGTDWLKY
jgi:hypothetical protein